MEHWSRDTLFLVTGLLSGLAGAAMEARTHKRISVGWAMLSCVIYGLTGAALGMLGYQFWGEKHPEMILATGMFVGLRLLKTKFVGEIVTTIYRRLLGMDNKQ